MIRRKSYDLLKSPFFQLKSRRKLATLLGISFEELKAFSAKTNFYGSGFFECGLYKRLWKLKKEKHKWSRTPPDVGEEALYRPIDIPIADLKKVQSKIADFLSRITPPDWLFCPVKGRSAIGNAAFHRGGRAFWKLDISDFFGNCTRAKISWFFNKRMQCSVDVTACIVHLATVNGVLPQGSPCSPILSFLAYSEMWEEIESVIKAAGLKHSLYIDDINISGDIVRKNDIWKIKKIIQKHGLAVKKSKEQSTVNKPAEVTGVILVGRSMRAPNEQHQKLHFLEEQKAKECNPLRIKSLARAVSSRKSQIEQIAKANLPETRYPKFLPIS